MLGIFPVFIIAGFIEGFVTRHTETPDAIRAVFIILCLFFVLAYYVIYPYRMAKRGFVSDIQETKLPPTQSEEINFLRIKSNGEIFTDVFVFYRKYISTISAIAVGSSVIYVAVLLAVFGHSMPEMMLFRRWSVTNILSWYIHAENLGELFDYNTMSILLLLNSLLFSSIIFMTLKWLKAEQTGIKTPFLSEKKNRQIDIINFMKIAVVVLITQFAVLFIPYGIIIALIPIIMLWLSSMVLEGKNLGSSLGRSLALFGGSIAGTYSLAIMIFLVMMVFSFISNTEITWHLLDVLGWNFADRTTDTPTFLYAALIFLFTLSFGFLLPILTAAYGLLYYTLIEIRDATSLKKRVEEIGIKQKAYGLDRE